MSKDRTASAESLPFPPTSSTSTAGRTMQKSVYKRRVEDHCNELVPTIYEVIGITPPPEVSGVAQDPINGVSFAYSFDDPKAEG